MLGTKANHQKNKASKICTAVDASFLANKKYSGVSSFKFQSFARYNLTSLITSSLDTCPDKLCIKKILDRKHLILTGKVFTESRNEAMESSAILEISKWNYLQKNHYHTSNKL